MNLPKVSPETIMRIVNEMMDPNAEEMLAIEGMLKLETENPHIGSLIALLANDSKDTKLVAICALLVYRILEAELNVQALVPLEHVN